MPSCLFCQIVAGNIDADIVRTGELTLAFRDIRPQAPVHVLIVPKEHLASIAELTEEHGDLLVCGEGVDGMFARRVEPGECGAVQCADGRVPVLLRRRGDCHRNGIGNAARLCRLDQPYEGQPACADDGRHSGEARYGNGADRHEDDLHGDRSEHQQQHLPVSYRSEQREALSEKIEKRFTEEQAEAWLTNRASAVLALAIVITAPNLAATLAQQLFFTSLATVACVAVR